MTEPIRKRRRRSARGPSIGEKTPYEELDVSQTATPGEIRAAYLAKVRQYPPEREPEGFKRVQRAYTVLRDAAGRRELDRTVFRTSLEPDAPEGGARAEEVDCGALFRERVLSLLLSSSDLYVTDFSRFYGNVDGEIESLS